MNMSISRRCGVLLTLFLAALMLVAPAEATTTAGSEE